MHPNEELARRELEVVAAGDTDAIRALYAEDFVLHYPGRNPLAGDHDIETFLGKLGALFGEDATVERTLHDALGSDDHAVQLLTVSVNARGRSHTWHPIFVMHVRDGKIAEAWISVDDQHALDDFLNALARG